MQTLDVVRRLHQHRMWANSRLLQAVDPLYAEDLKRQFAIGQGTIWRSLVHMYAAEWVWLATVCGDEFPVLPGDSPDQLPGNQQGEGGLQSFAELRTAWSELDDRWRTYLNELAETQLENLIYKTSSIQKTRQPTRLIDILLHVCTHAHYTTAQVINMLRQAGTPSLPDPMLITMARRELASDR